MMRLRSASLEIFFFTTAKKIKMFLLLTSIMSINVKYIALCKSLYGTLQIHYDCRLYLILVNECSDYAKLFIDNKESVRPP